MQQRKLLAGATPLTLALFVLLSMANVDDTCTSTAWLTLGKGPQPQSIMTDSTGFGREELFRVLPASPGAEFDIHFRVIEQATSMVVLTSRCYQFTISQ